MNGVLAEPTRASNPTISIVAPLFHSVQPQPTILLPDNPLEVKIIPSSLSPHTPHTPHTSPSLPYTTPHTPHPKVVF
ncbi:MAG: hypothetical protein F6J93_00660 [Oscillatoria sp. SIO1A7]|nr:hypothetical protein [Oscillatoria sp. SIO1A7]